MHGPGDDRRRQLRPGDRQRPVGLRAGPDRTHSGHQGRRSRRDFGFEPDFERGKHYLEANDSAGNTFKATAKPVLIGTAVVGATTMIFSIILLLGKAGLLHLSLTDAPVLLGFICGGAVIFWFSGASMQAVTTGAYRAVEYIKKNMDLNKKEADIEDSKTVVRICTEYAQKGMWNIFIALMSITLAFAFFDPNFFVAYLISIAVFGLFQAISWPTPAVPGTTPRSTSRSI